MLLEFSVTNYRSFKDRVTLSMLANSSGEHEETHVMPESSAAGRTLRTGIIYGPNGAGKSNLLEAFALMRDIVVKSSEKFTGEDLPAQPYLFDTKTASEPTEFEVVFVEDGVRFQYGFSFTARSIVAEWLFAFPKGRAQRWISRETDVSTGEQQKSFSEKVPGQRSVWLDATRENSLLLSTAVQLNSTALKPVFNWFKKRTRVIFSGVNYPEYTASICADPVKRRAVVDIMKAADFDIEDININKEKFDTSKLPADMPDALKEQVLEKLKDQDVFQIHTLHRTSDGRSVPLELDDESEGTKKFFGLIGPWIDILGRGVCVFIDELHESLHPVMLRLLVNMFHNPVLNCHGAQLVFTTHDTSLLAQDFMRRDQIWFVEKSVETGSTLFPLTNFSPRKDREDLEKAYLDGRYGALPFVDAMQTALGMSRGK